MIYGDTSFLSALYRQGDSFHATAAKLAGQLQQPIALTLLGELELHNSIHRCLAAKLVERSEHDAIFRQIDEDIDDGILVRKAVQELDLYSRAKELSRKFTPEVSARSLDLLHVAAAQLLKATLFVSFDAKQRMLVRKVGINLQPRTLMNG